MNGVEIKAVKRFTLDESRATDEPQGVTVGFLGPFEFEDAGPAMAQFTVFSAETLNEGSFEERRGSRIGSVSLEMPFLLELTIEALETQRVEASKSTLDRMEHAIAQARIGPRYRTPGDSSDE